MPAYHPPAQTVGLQLVDITGSFRINGTATPDGVRSGRTAFFTVARVSQGLFAVTLAAGIPVPERFTYENASISSRAARVRSIAPKVVVDSWNPTTRTFQIACDMVGDTSLSAYADAAIQDPDDNDRISFWMRGSISSVGTDPVG